MAFAAFEGEGEVASASGTTAGFHPSPVVVSEAVDLKWVTSVVAVVSGFGIVIKLNDGSDHMRATATLPKSKVKFEAVLNRTELEMAGFNPHDSVKDHFELLSDAMRSPDDGLWTDASLVSVSPVAAGRWDANAIGDLKPHRGLPTAKGVALRLTVFEKVRRKTRKFYLLLSAAEFSETDELREKCAHLEADLQKSKREIAEMKKKLTGMAALREDNERMQAQLKKRDREIAQLKKQLEEAQSMRSAARKSATTTMEAATITSTATEVDFRFDGYRTGACTEPSYYKLTRRGRIAHITQSNGYGKQIFLTPEIASGCRKVTFYVKATGRIFYVGFVDSAADVLQGHSLRSDGVVHACGKEIGNIGLSIEKGDSIELSLNLDRKCIVYSVTGKLRNRSKVTRCQFKSLPVYIGFTGFGGSKLSIV